MQCLIWCGRVMNRETEEGGTFQAREVKLWNAIPLDERNIDTVNNVKNAFNLVLTCLN